MRRKYRWFFISRSILKLFRWITFLIRRVFRGSCWWFDGIVGERMMRWLLFADFSWWQSSWGTPWWGIARRWLCPNEWGPSIPRPRLRFWKLRWTMIRRIFQRRYQRWLVAYDLDNFCRIPGTDLALSEAKKNLGMKVNFLSIIDYLWLIYKSIIINKTLQISSIKKFELSLKTNHQHFGIKK